jgi:hypothetical protein
MRISSNWKNYEKLEIQHMNAVRNCLFLLHVDCGLSRAGILIVFMGTE